MQLKWQFFAKSPFKSAGFLLIAFLALVVTVCYLAMLIRYWDRLSSEAVSGLLILAFTGGLGGTWRLIKEHEEINEQFLAGRIQDVPENSPLESSLNLAARALQTKSLMNLVSLGLFLALTLKILSS